MLAKIYHEKGDIQKEVNTYIEYLRANPKDVEVLIRTGNLYLTHKNYVLAERFLARAIAIDPKNMKSHFYLAVCSEYNKDGQRYGKGADFDKAFLHYNECLRINPEHLETHFNLGSLYAHLGKIELAKKEFSTLAQLAPNSPYVHYNLGCIYDDMGFEEEAISEYQTALALDPYYIDAMFNLGYVLVKLKDYKTAANTYRRIIEIDPDYVDAILNLAILYDSFLKNKKKANYYYHMYAYKQTDASLEEKKIIKRRIIRLNPA